MTVVMLGFDVTPVFFRFNAFFCIFYLCVDDMLYDFKLVIHTIQDSNQRKKDLSCPSAGWRLNVHHGMSLTCFAYYVRTLNHYQISN